MASAKAKQIINALRVNRHPSAKGEWACFEELKSSTGYTYQDRYIDLFCVNCWPSKNFRSVAYEVKISRSDFMHEIADPAKRSFAEEYAMECWFATPSGMVATDEVPEGWGLVVLDKAGTLKTMKMPKQKPQLEKAWPMGFVASMLRKSADGESKASEALWNLAGTEMDEDMLIAAVDERIAAELRKRASALRSEIRREFRKENDDLITENFKYSGDFRKIAEVLGHRNPYRATIEEILQLASGKSASTQLANSIEDCIGRMQSVLQSLKAAPSDDGADS